MLVEMNKQEFAALGYGELLVRCTEPAVERMRVSSRTDKIQILSELNHPQQALFMVRLLYPAYHSAVDFAAWIPYLMEQTDYWSGVTQGLSFFGENSLLRLLDETKQVFEARKQTEHSVESQASCDPLFTKFQNLYQDSLERISKHIRSHPEAFVQLVN